MSKIIKFNKLNIVGVLKKEDTEVFNLLSIHKKGNKINILTFRSFGSFEKLLKAIDNKTPIVLNIDGKGVLNKKINANNETNTNWLKTIDYNSIYHTTYQETELSFISFCRNTVVQEYFELLHKEKLEILDVYVGSFIGAILKDFVNKETYNSGELLLQFEENSLENFNRKEKESTVIIGNDSLQSKYLPLYASAVHFYLKSDNITKTESKILNIEEIIYKKAFNNFGIGMLVGFFLLLLASYSFIQYYNSKNTDLNLQSLYSNQSYKQLKSLEKKREQQLLIMEESGLGSSKYTTNLAHSILKTIPNNIKLTDLDYFPIDTEIKTEKKVIFTANTIIIKGQTTDETIFNNWLLELKTLDWAKKFEIINLKKDKKGISNFEVKIIVNHV